MGKKFGIAAMVLGVVVAASVAVEAGEGAGATQPAHPSATVASETPLLKACLELKKDPSDANWQRVLGLAAALKDAIGPQHGTPHDKPLDVAALLKMADAKGRYTLLYDARYVSTDPPGPGESYINHCAVFLDGSLVPAAPLGIPPRKNQRLPAAWDGFILNSVVVVNGKVTTTSYISNSIVIATGPISIDSYILNSLVISLDSLKAIAESDDARPRDPKLAPTVSVNNGYISKSTVIGAVSCRDLRDCTILGCISGPQPYLRGATIESAARVAPLLWRIDKPAALGH